MIIWDQRLVQPFENARLSFMDQPYEFVEKTLDRYTEKVEELNKRLENLPSGEWVEATSKGLLASLGHGGVFQICA